MERKAPSPTVDLLIEYQGGVVLVRRKYEPHGWALPGGFVDYGESCEDAAVREALEETSLQVTLECQLKSYSDPKRDARKHTISVVFVAQGSGTLKGADDALEARVFTSEKLPFPLCFDHEEILQDYFHYKKTGKRPTYL